VFHAAEMSFLSSLHQFVSDAGSSISESARKLVATNSRGSEGGLGGGEDSSGGAGTPRLHLPLSGKNSGLGGPAPGSRRGSRYNLNVLAPPATTSGNSLTPAATLTVLTPSGAASPGMSLLQPSPRISPGASPKESRIGSRRGSSIRRKGREDHDQPQPDSWHCSSAVARARQQSLQTMLERRTQPRTAVKTSPEYKEVPEMWGPEGLHVSDA